MAKRPKPRRGRQKGEQQHLPDMAPVKNDRIHKLALSYVRVRDARMELTVDEVKAQELLQAAMQDEGIADYEYEDIKVQMTTNLKVKVKKTKQDE